MLQPSPRGLILFHEQKYRKKQYREITHVFLDSSQASVMYHDLVTQIPDLGVFVGKYSYSTLLSSLSDSKLFFKLPASEKQSTFLKLAHSSFRLPRAQAGCSIPAHLLDSLKLISVNSCFCFLFKGFMSHSNAHTPFKALYFTQTRFLDKHTFSHLVVMFLLACIHFNFCIGLHCTVACSYIAAYRSSLYFYSLS